MVRQLIFGGGDIYVEIMIMLKASLAVTRQLFGSLQSILVPDNRKPRCLPMNEGFFRVSALASQSNPVDFEPGVTREVVILGTVDLLQPSGKRRRTDELDAPIYRCKTLLVWLP
ncbi:hypothetical protein PGTUg99_015048 [Puccinia graminis f. sp. tritici]|uniref:Uncharacterized protein n=1 Tax=Puccinia graminis f. sp. tritici TaxID=56615 RepID=A0A5B0RY60_PUCGR|nr:hypothetical protein PGTUg99_015048 [Puccinia graminis f. sp. tritici]